MGTNVESREVASRPPRPRWWFLVAGVFLIPLVGFGVVFASCQYALDHVDNAGIFATTACLGLAVAYPANGPAPTFPDGFRPPAIADSAQQAEFAAQYKAKYRPLAHALDELDAAVRHRNRADIAASVPHARQLCAPLLPTELQNTFGLTTTTIRRR